MHNPNSIAALRSRRLAASSKPFRARGSDIKRCGECLLRQDLCMCRWRPRLQADAKFCLIMHNLEPLKPSNTGRLIGELLPETEAFLWSRTEPDAAMLETIRAAGFTPYLIFPGDYCAPERVCHQPDPASGTRPLFILLDATWQQARKMFRKSPWLDQVPVLELKPERASRYRLRRAYREQHLCTAEVAIELLHLNGDRRAAAGLDAYFEAFTERYMAGRLNRPVDETAAHYQVLSDLGHGDG